MKQFMYETENTKIWQQVYDNLADDLSREIYLARSLYSLTCDRDHLKDIIRKMPLSLALRSQTAQHFDSKLALVGAGDWANYILRFFPEIHWDYIADNFKAGSDFHQNPVITPEDLYQRTKGESVYIVVSVLFGYHAIVKQLTDLGFRQDQILSLGEITYRHQYFDLEAIHFNRNEVFLDIGALDGSTSRRFAEVTKNQYKEILCFEPNKESYEICQHNLRDLHDVTVLNKGASDQTGLASMSGSGGGANILLSSSNSETIETTRIDDVCKEASYIKMDIEGVELDALHGAAQLISSHRPKLAISVYHLRTDIWTIPQFLISLHPDYRLYLRMYSLKGNDVVLYAL